MEFTVLTPESEEKFNNICRRIRRLQSGGTIDSLQTLGVDTGKQIGASFVSLKSLASSYEPDELLATLLWKQQRREEQIIACFLFPVDLNKEKITQLAFMCHNFEVAEYFGSILLSKHPELESIAEQWSNSPEPFLQVCALTGVARHLIINKKTSALSPGFFQRILKKEFNNKYVGLVAERYRFNFKKC